MSTRPTADTVLAEIAALKEVKPQLPQRNFFGDDNHDAIDAQIEVLENNLSEEFIYRRFSDDETAEEFTDDHFVLDHALDARRWMLGEVDDLDPDAGSPSEGWRQILKK